MNYIEKNAVSQAAWRFAEKVVADAGVVDDQVAAELVTAFALIPRLAFASEAFAGSTASKYILQDIAIPVGYKQHMLRPSVLARMLGLLGVKKGERVLHIGAGSGYSSALMASMGAKVYALEKNGLLAQQARQRLDSLGFQNVLIRASSGFSGWTEHAPYDAALLNVLWSVAEIEQAKAKLFEQIASGGRIVALVGDKDEQQLTMWENKNGDISIYRFERDKFI